MAFQLYGTITSVHSVKSNELIEYSGSTHTIQNHSQIYIKIISRMIFPIESLRCKTFLVSLPLVDYVSEAENVSVLLPLRTLGTDGANISILLLKRKFP